MARKRKQWSFRLNDTTQLEVSAVPDATRRQIRRRGRWSLVALLAAGALIAAAIALGAVTTDQPSYAPGSTVHITGDGMLAAASVSISILRPDGVTDTHTTTSAADGTFAYDYVLPGLDSPVYGTYDVTATDGTNRYTTTFTDDQPAHVYFATSGLPDATSVTVSGINYTNAGGVSKSTSRTFDSPGPSDVVDAFPSTSLSFSFPTVSGCTFDHAYIGTAPGTTVTSPITTGAANSNTTITGAYSCLSVDAGGPYSGNEGSAIALGGASVTGAGAGAAYSWSVDTNGSIAGDTAGDLGIACTFSPSANVINPSVTCNDDSNGGHFTLTLSYTDDAHTTPITDTAQLTVSNVAPSVTLDSGNTYTFGESATAERSFAYSVSDPGSNDAITMTTGCGTGGTKAGDNSDALSSGNGTLKCIYPDGPATPTIGVQAADDDGGSNQATHNVTVDNVAPTVNAFTVGASNCGVSISSVSFSDPAGSYDAPYAATVNWGDGGGDVSLGTVTSPFGPLTHTYSAPGTYTVTVTVTDKDGGTGSNHVDIDNTPTLAYPLPPIMPGKTFNTGSAIPVKVQVSGCTAGLTPQIDISPLNGTITSKGKSNLNDYLRYTTALPGFIYNWNTKGWATGTYTVTISGLPGSVVISNDVQLVK